MCDCQYSGKRQTREVTDIPVKCNLVISTKSKM